MGKISIKIHNMYGLNKLRGEDLSTEESIALIELAKTMVLQTGAQTLTAEPLTYDYSKPILNSENDSENQSSSEDIENDSDEDIIVDDEAQTAEPQPQPDILNLSTEEQIELLNKDFHTTGVKHKLYGGEILPFYRVRWECPKCGDRGNHYGPENIKQMFCYNCNAALLVRPAAGKFPNRDEWGNYFVADELNMKFMRA